MKTVQPLKVPHGKQLDSPLLDAFGMARHDSGDMATFKATCQKYGASLSYSLRLLSAKLPWSQEGKVLKGKLTRGSLMRKAG